MSKKEDEGKIIEGHEYDGIRELDNRLPRWWLATFYISIFFGIGYYYYYELGDGPGLQDELKADLAAIELKQTVAPQNKSFDESKLNSMAKDAGSLAKGKAVYTAKCLSCHGDKGQGLIGPNLTDDYWINGNGSIGAIAAVIRDGVAAKGMPAWGAMITEPELYEVTAFVKSLHGSNPAGAKPPQGNLVK